MKKRNKAGSTDAYQIWMCFSHLVAYSDSMTRTGRFGDIT